MRYANRTINSDTLWGATPSGVYHKLFLMTIRSCNYHTSPTLPVLYTLCYASIV